MAFEQAVAGGVLARRRPLMGGRSREQVFALIRAHLADELEDLEADSLDLYTLVQELEDTYGVKMTDEQAAQILTVGQAVDYVMAHDGTTDAA